MDKELRDRLYWLEEELSEEEYDLIFRDGDDADEEVEEAPSVRRRRLSRAEKLERARLEELDPIEERSVPVQKKKGIKGLVFLAVLEIIGILLIMGWWLQWLI